MGISPLTFIILDGLAALISVPVWVVGGWYFAKNLDQALAYAKQAQLYLFGSIVLFVLCYFLIKNFLSKKIPNQSDL